MTNKENFQFYDLEFGRDLDARVMDYIYRTQAVDEGGKPHKTMMRWIGFDRLASKLGELLQPMVLLFAADRLTEMDNEYLQNAGLTLLGLPQVADFLVNNGQNLGEVIDKFEHFIPDRNNLGSLSNISRANFIRSVEGLLQIQVAFHRRINPVKDGEALQKLDLVYKLHLLKNRYGEKITSDHVRILRECCGDLDMKNTLIFE